MKDYTLIANNKNKTKITFSYDHGLPYKDKVRPNLEYGDWEDEPHKTLIKINFNDLEMKMFENKNKISIKNINLIDNEFWIDLNDVYLMINYDKKLDQQFDNHNVIFAFLYNNKIISIIKI